MVPLGPARFAVRVLVVMTFPAVCIPASGNDGGGNGPAVDGPILYAPITLGLGDHALRDTLLMALHIAAVDPV